jgi:hypothetical protein
MGMGLREWSCEWPALKPEGIPGDGGLERLEPMLKDGEELQCRFCAFVIACLPLFKLS